MKKSRGSALIFVIIILIPVMTLSMVLLELAFSDFKTSSNVINSQQALYNAEAGIRHGIKRLQETHFNGSLVYNDLDYVYDGGNSYSTSNIKYNYTTRIFKLSSTGFYGGIARSKALEIDKYSITNLRRKFSTGEMTAINGRVNFKTLNTGSYVKLQNYEQLLLFGEGVVNPSSNIYTFFSTQNPSSALRNTGIYLFQNDSSNVSEVFKVSTADADRKIWKSYGTGINYYVSDIDESINLNLENISGESNIFLKDFKDLGGTINEEGKFVNSCVRIIIADGDLNISGIKGEAAPGVTNAERYFENLVIYCTGKVTINDSELYRYGESSDLNLAIISGSVEFVSLPESMGSIISHLKGNEGLIKQYENMISEVLLINTDGEYICATGY